MIEREAVENKRGRLLTEASEMCKFRWIVGHGSDEPVNSCLPHGIEKATEYVKDNFCSISWGKNVFLLGIRGN
jgi:hypothetical protein